MAGIAVVIGVAPTYQGQQRKRAGNCIRSVRNAKSDREKHEAGQRGTIEPHVLPGDTKLHCGIARLKRREQSKSQAGTEERQRQQQRSASALAVFPNFICNAH